ncbi:MFS transporter [Furfurilactobacillus entadae]|uniref:MFS transporter n=1 Tax=Furfurilactobacillus entadae TaxID=2922307 RepID=UPI0035F044F8
MSNSKRLFVSALFLLTGFMVLLNQTMMVTALPIMAKTLHVSLQSAQWLTSGYVLVIGLVTPVSATLLSRFSSRKLYLAMVTVFIIGTLLGPLTNQFSIILLARLIQATAGGILMTFVMVSMMEMYPANQRGVVMGYVALVIAAGPALGPTLSGLLMSVFPWTAIFWLVLPIMVVIFVVSLMVVPEISPAEPNVHIDLRSVVTSIVGVGLIMSSLTEFSQNVPVASVMLVVGLIATGDFLHRQLTLTTPLLDIRLFKHMRFTTMMLAALLAFAVLMGTETLMPVYIETGMGRTSLVAGLLMFPGAIVNAVASPFVGRIYDGRGARGLLISGLIILLVSAVPFLFMTKTSNIIFVMIVYVVRMLGVSIFMAVTLTEALVGLKATELNYGTAFNNTLRQVGGSATATILMMVVSTAATTIHGFQLSMWVTLGLILLLTVVTGYYLVKSQKVGA